MPHDVIALRLTCLPLLRRAGLLRAASALSLIAVMNATTPAWAGGAGGRSGVGRDDGDGGLGSSGASIGRGATPGSNGASGSGGHAGVDDSGGTGVGGNGGIIGGGFGSGGGGGGGAGRVITLDGTLSSSVTGGGGGGASYGGGGGGGDGLVFIGTTLNVNAAVTGGKGGASTVGGGGGGGGGDGLAFTGVTLNVNADVTGGAGGSGGPLGGAAGGGGVGVLMNNGGTLTLGSGASITGGGAGANRGVGGPGGVGVAGANLTIISSGTISGGLNSDGPGRAAAVLFTGGSNRLELRAGYSLNGNVVGNAGSTNTLILGGGANAGFDVSKIGAQYQGFSGFEKSGTSTWTLSGTTTALTPWTIAGGVLSVSADANLGSAAGGLSFNGGTLATTTSFNTARAVTLTGSSTGSFDVANGTTLGLSGVISGSGALVKTGSGQITLSGANTYTGGTTISGGTLQVGNGGTTGSLVGNITNNGTLAFNRSDAISFDGVISGLGGLVQAGSGTLILSGTSTYTGATTVSGGTLAIASTGGIASDVTNSATFENAGSVTGSVSNLAGAIANKGLITGALTQTAGTTVNNGTITGAVMIDGGLFRGIGTSGSLTVNAGGTVAPGNSIGTMNVAGNVTFTAGSVYQVEINAAGQADRIAATGNATLNGGTVQVLAGVGMYAPATTYTILTANGGVTGVFAGVSSDLAFLDPVLGYDAGSVYLTMRRNNVHFSGIGGTRNQIAAAGGADSLGRGNPVYSAVVNLSGEQARTAFDSLSGEIHASAKTALIEDSRFVREAANDRIRAAFGNVGASTAPVMTYGANGPVATAATTENFAVWGQGFGSWGHHDSDGNAARLNHNTGGFLMGADTPVFDGWRVGVISGYSRTRFDEKDRASSGTSDNYHLGLYGGTNWGQIGFRSGLAYTWHDIDSSRLVGFPGFSDSLHVGYNAGTFQAFGELGYRIDTAMAAFEPFANLAYVNLNTDGFSERGGMAALSVTSRSTNTAFTTLGLRASTGFTLGTLNLTARGTLGWKHAFGDTASASMQSFAGSNAFIIAGVPLAKNAAVIEAGLDLNMASAAAFGLSYNGQIAKGAQQHGFKASLNMRF